MNKMPSDFLSNQFINDCFIYSKETHENILEIVDMVNWCTILLRSKRGYKIVAIFSKLCKSK